MLTEEGTLQSPSSACQGKKTRKIRTKHDYEERVTPERYREIMRDRTNVTAQGHEKVPRGVTRSGLIRKK